MNLATLRALKQEKSRIEARIRKISNALDGPGSSNPSPGRRRGNEQQQLKGREVLVGGRNGQL
jgi:hypothetical protein